MEESYEIIDNIDETDSEWEKELVILSDKGLQNRSFLVNLLQQLRTVEAVVKFLRVSPQNQPCNVDQEESPEGHVLLPAGESPGASLNMHYFSASAGPPPRITQTSSTSRTNPTDNATKELMKTPNSVLATLEELNLELDTEINENFSASFVLSSPLTTLVKPRKKRRNSLPELNFESPNSYLIPRPTSPIRCHSQPESPNNRKIIKFETLPRISCPNFADLMSKAVKPVNLLMPSEPDQKPKRVVDNSNKESRSLENLEEMKEVDENDAPRIKQFSIDLDENDSPKFRRVNLANLTILRSDSRPSEDAKEDEERPQPEIVQKTNPQPVFVISDLQLIVNLSVCNIEPAQNVDKLNNFAVDGNLTEQNVVGKNAQEQLKPPLDCDDSDISELDNMDSVSNAPVIESVEPRKEKNTSWFSRAFTRNVFINAKELAFALILTGFVWLTIKKAIINQNINEVNELRQKLFECEQNNQEILRVD